jgi:hypothetical protein
MSTEDLLKGLLVTTPKGGNPPADGSGNERKAPVVEPKEGEAGETNPPSGDAGDDNDALWNSLSEAEEAVLSEHSKDGDDEAGESEGGKKDDDDSATGNDTEPFYTVTIDGKQERVALSEALAGYQRNADYTRKTQEVSDKRKQVEAEFETAQKVRGAYDALLKQVQEQVEGAINVKPETWEKLKAEDPAQFAVQWAEHQQRTEARNAIVAERDRIAKETHAEHNNKLREVIDGERVKLLDKIPEWKDKGKYEAGAKQILEHAGKAYGFTDAELAQVYDHRMILLARDAARYRALVAKAEKGKAKVDNAPIVPPRGRVPQKTSQQRVTEEAKARFRRSGKPEDAVALILAR